MNRIAVLLSTYNGERYLAEQLESLWAQTVSDFDLVIRDDGSTDGTLALLHAVHAARPMQVRLIDRGRVDPAAPAQRLGPKDSFARLLAHVDAPYVAFCDQDDRWMPDKLETTLAAIKRAEALHGCDTPVLACSDAIITDQQLNPIGPPYLVKHRLTTSHGRELTLARLLFRNYAIGATTMLNAALAARCRAVPAKAIMHDWWCALVATLIGRVVVLPRPLMLYRQHDANVIGSSGRKLPTSSKEAREALAWSQRGVMRSVQQAQALHAAFARQLTSEQLRVLEPFLNFNAQTAPQRLLTIARTGAYKPGFALNGLHLLACMTAPMR